MNYLKQAQAIEDQLIEDRRWLHQHPEIQQNCQETFSYIKTRLEELNISYKELGTAGIVAEVGKTPGKTILLRGDMDALPMKEESGLPFASKRDCAHTCGHDMHTASLLGAAKLLKQNEDQLEGTVRFMFQADEESLTGARDMIQQGVLNGVDAAFGMHVSTGDPEVGEYLYNVGPSMASSNIFKITVNGHGAHGASPHMGIDPINVCCHIHSALQTLIAREINIQQPAVITIGKFTGGDAPNIIPETCEMMGTLRTFDKTQQAHLKQRIEEIVIKTAEVFQATGKVEFLFETLPLVNDPELTLKFKDYCQEIGTLKEGPKAMGSEDFALVLDQVPGAFFRLGAGGKEALYHEGGGHHPKVRFNEKALVYGVAAYCTIATKYLQEYK